MKKKLRIFLACIVLQCAVLPVFAQPANDNCSSATSFGSLPVPGACIGGVQDGAVVTMSNQSTVGATGANPYSYITGCSGGGNMAAPALDTWYSFVATGSFLNVGITGFPNASIGLWAGIDCNNLAAIGCGNVPGSGNGTFTFNSLQVGQTYYIQISGGNATATDNNFSISLDNDLGCDDCLRTSTLTAYPLPVNGEYAPGQVVHFCFTVTEWVQTNTNWFHGVQVSMGAGWTGAITNTSASATCQVGSAGNWGFYPTGIGVVNGVNWGPGFYFDSELGGPLDGNPANNYGDDCSGAGLNWQFCFDLTVSSACVAGQNLGVTINTSGDGESGSWYNIACQQDPANALSAVKAQGPVLSNSSVTTVCSGAAVNFPLAANVPASFTWVAADNPNVSGESLTTQNSGIITDVLVNNTTTAQTVVYTIVPTATATGCVGVPRTVTVTVNPRPTASVTANGPLCTGDNAVFTITGTPNAIVTYNINGGASQTVTLDAAGNATVTVPGVTVNTSLNILLVAMPSTTVTGVGVSATGGINSFNSTGALSAAGITATNANATLINNTAAQLIVTLQHTVPAGTVLTISIARNNNAGNVTISDGSATQIFNAGPNLTLQYITFTTTIATNTITFNRTAGGVWVDGIRYTLTTPGCSSTIPSSATVIVSSGVVPTFTAIPAFCSGTTAPVLPTTSNNGITGTWSPATVNNTASGTYTFTPAAGQCATGTTMNITVTSQVTPTFTAIPAFCSGTTAPVLPTTSNNGIAGTWSPVTVNNTTSGTYTFTPNAGQCATATTMNITVTSPVTPTFTAIPAFCSGTTAPVLPATSNNGITGIWSPGTVNNTTSGTYTFTPNAGQCATGTTMNITVTSPVTPTFTAIPAFCSGTTAPVLPLTSNNGITGTWSPATVNNTTSGTYTFTPNAGPCATGTTMNITVTSQVTPTFTAIPAFCSGSTAPVLPATSNNGITGTWSSATVNNTTSGTYTFTPNAGQCATGTTMNITVTSQVTPTFTAIPAFCSGTTAPVLPTTSNNGIAGTWSPATVNNTTSGTYTFTPTAGQCATIVTMDIVVHSNTSSATNIIICSSQLPYTWNGNTYTVAGSYTVHLTNSVGCDSAATLNLVVNNTTSSTTNTSICNTALPYNWNGNSYASAGSYIVHLTNSVGCDSAATLNLVVNNATTSTTSVSVCNTALPYSWNGNNYSSAGSYIVHLTNSMGCDSAATLNLVVNSTTASTTNVSVCNTALPYSWNGNNYSSAGSYIVHLTNSLGCDSTATLNLVVNNATTSTTNVSICNTALPYSWNGNNYLSAGSYIVHLTNSAGCDSAATLNLIVNNVTMSTTNVSICNTSLPYSWNGNSYASAGSYIVHLINSVGCDSAATLNLVVNNVTTSTTNVSICNSALPYSWNGNSYASAGSYIVHLTNSVGCDSAATLNLVVNNATVSTTNVNICNTALPYSWNGNNYSTAGSYTVHLTNSAGCDSAATLNLVVNNATTSTTNVSVCNTALPYSWNGNNYSSAGSYIVHLTNSVGCDSAATLNLVVNNVTTSTTNVSICNTALPYSWNGNNYASAGSYIVHLTNSVGCDSAATLNLVVNNATTSTTSVSVCNTALPFAWNGNLYNSAGSYTIHLTNSAGCDSAATLILAVGPASSSITNTSICSNALPYSWNGQTYTTAGAYAVLLTASSGCDSLATLNLIVNNPSSSTTNIVLCNSALPYNWNGNVYTSAGNYTVHLVNSVGCDSSASLHLAVNNSSASTTNTAICASALPYTWNVNTYTSAGTYTVHLMNSVGCDSAATLNLAVNNATASITNVGICNSALPYTWNGNVYSAGGSYIVHLVNSAGCDSAATLNLVINNTTTSTTNVSICNTALPYTWNGNIYASAGNYIVHLTNSAGCDSAATLYLVVNNTSNSTTYVSICSSALPYTWNGNTYASAGSYTVHLTNSVGCDSAATLQLVANNATSSLTSIAICSSALPYSWNGNLYTGAGSYTVHLTNSNGCDSAAVLQLAISNPTTSSTNISVCPAALPYTWNGNVYNSAGTYTVHLVNQAGCDSAATLLLSVKTNTSSVTSVSLCSSSLPYTWNSQAITASGTYQALLINAAGCDSVASLQLTVIPSPAPPTVTAINRYCQFETATPLQATGTGTIQWYTTATGGTALTTAPVPSTAVAGTQIFYVSQANGTCESPRTPVQVIVAPKPLLGADKLLEICFGATANLNNSFNTTGYSSTWQHNNLPVANPAVVAQPGVYELMVQSAAGCRDTATVTLQVLPQMIANAGPDANAEYNHPYQLQGSGNGTIFTWSPAAVLNNAHIANPLATLINDTRFILEVSNSIGCKAYDTVLIKVFKGPTIYVPTAFSPNGDGLNDIFRATAVGIESLSYFRVFNRYGQLVWQTTNLSQGWDGRYNGTAQNIGNYVWMIQGIDRLGKAHTMKGNLVLMR
ncbi:MAG: gliding motility-associated C-terminal domain-containing protein [Ferruginibacter sp.]